MAQINLKRCNDTLSLIRTKRECVSKMGHTDTDVLFSTHARTRLYRNVYHE